MRWDWKGDGEEVVFGRDGGGGAVLARKERCCRTRRDWRWEAWR